MTTKNEIDWSLTSWESSCREQYRRWSQLTLREILLAQEEMQDLAEKLNPVFMILIRSDFPLTCKMIQTPYSENP